MRYPKATLRRSGSKMMTVNISFDIDIRTIGNILAWDIWEPEELPSTRHEAWKIVIKYLQERGPNYCRGDHVTDRLDDAAQQRAQELFPELTGD